MLLYDLIFSKVRCMETQYFGEILCFRGRCAVGAENFICCLLTGHLMEINVNGQPAKLKARPIG